MVLVSHYDYKLVFRNTLEHGNADAFSQLPLKTQHKKDYTPTELVLLTEHLADSLVISDQICSWTQRDPVLSKQLQYNQNGWPTTVDPLVASFASKKSELSSHDSCILWGSRVLILDLGREPILQELHCGHSGITKMKSLSRMYMWWPTINSDIEKTVRRCTDCQSVQSAPPVSPLQLWKWPTHSWSRVHVKFSGPFQNKLLLVVVAAHSNWVEAKVVSSTSSVAAITNLRTLFAQFGLPELIVLDNGLAFTSQEFTYFMKNNGIVSPVPPSDKRFS